MDDQIKLGSLNEAKLGRPGEYLHLGTVHISGQDPMISSDVGEVEEVGPKGYYYEGRAGLMKVPYDSNGRRSFPVMAYFQGDGEISLLVNHNAPHKSDVYRRAAENLLVVAVEAGHLGLGSPDFEA